MVQYKTLIYKYGKNGEKTGWTYIDVPLDIAQEINPNCKTSYRIKGKLDNLEISGISIIPIGEGNFILPLNADLRKKLGKKEGATIELNIELDSKPFEIDAEFESCLNEVQEALNFFNTLTKGHQNYFSKWISSAKTQATKEKRIVRVVRALSLQMDYATMIRDKSIIETL